jgi:hypothetical protein
MTPEEIEDLHAQIKFQNLSYAVAGYQFAIISVAERLTAGENIIDVIQELANIQGEQLEARLAADIEPYLTKNRK